MSELTGILNYCGEQGPKGDKGDTGDTQVFVATYEGTTFAQIKAAADAGKIVIAKRQIDSNTIAQYILCNLNSSGATFTCLFNTSSQDYAQCRQVICSSTNGWSNGVVRIQRYT